jgi:hypothetical protein
MVYALRDSGGRKYQVGIMLRIGCDPTNQIVLQDPRVSYLHATLAEHEGNLLIRDENSSSGTFVNQTRIQGMVRLRAGDKISIGDTSFITEQVPEQIFGLPPVDLPAKKSGCSLGTWAILGNLMVFMACLVLLGGAYYVYKAPQGTQKPILALIGQGSGSIQIENLSDIPVYVFGTTVLERENEPTLEPDFLWEIGAFGTSNKTDLTSGALRIDFGTQSGDMDLGTCIFNLKAGQVYNFVVIPGHIIVDRTEFPQVFDRNPSSISEYDVANSSLCKYSLP